MTSAGPGARAKSAALVGCGTLGKRLGHRLIRAGFRLRVHDRDPEAAAPLIEAGASWADAPATLAGGAGFLLSCLPRRKDVEAVLLGERGVWTAASPGVVHLETSTVGPPCLRALEAAARERQIFLLDTPISRGPLDTSGTTLTAFAAGSAEALDRARPVLDAIVDKVAFCGPAGQGQVAKLVNNLVAHTLLVSLGQALTLGVKAGASLDLLAAALAQGTGQSRVLEEILPATVFRGDWRPGLTLEMAIKDLELASDLATEAGVPATLLDDVRECFRRAANRGWGNEAAHVVVRLAEEIAGVELRSPILSNIRAPRDPAS